MSPRETIAFLLTAPSKSQAVNGFVGLAGAQMGLKYGFMSLFCIVKGQQEQEIIAEPLIYGERWPLAPLLACASPPVAAFGVPGSEGGTPGGDRPCLSFPRVGCLGVGIPLGTSPARRLHPLPFWGGGGHPWGCRGGRASPWRGSRERPVPIGHRPGVLARRGQGRWHACPAGPASRALMLC